MGGFEQESQLGLGPERGSDRLKPGVGRGGPGRENKAGRRQWRPLLQSAEVGDENVTRLL